MVGDRHPSACDRLSDLDLWWLAALEPGLAGDAFLVFMLPLPPPVNDSIALPLQRVAATGSCFLLQLSGLWVIQEGNVIISPRPMAWGRSTWPLPATACRC